MNTNGTADAEILDSMFLKAKIETIRPREDENGNLKFSVLSYNPKGIFSFKVDANGLLIAEGAVDEFQKLLSSTTDTVELCMINLKYGSLLQKMKRGPEAIKWYDFIIDESEKDIKPAEVDNYAYKAYQKKAKIMFEILCFKTADEYLTKAEQILEEMEKEKEQQPSYEMLKHQKLVAAYYKKFQKLEKALTVLLEVYKQERKIYNAEVKSKDRIQSAVADQNEGEISPVDKLDDKKALDQAEKQEKDGVQIENEEQENNITKETRQDPFTVEKHKLRKSRNIKVRLGLTMIEIMGIYSSKRDKVKAQRFKEDAVKYILEGVDNNKTHTYYIKYLTAVGDMHIKYNTTKDLDIAYEAYEEANNALEKSVGKKSIDFIYSMVDIGDTYLEKKQFDQAEAFFGYAIKTLNEYYGPKSVFKTRVNSCLVELYTIKGGQFRDDAFKLSMENVDIVMESYGARSMFNLSAFMSGMSANIQHRRSNIADNLINEMYKICQEAGEDAKGNQYLFLASILLGVVSYSTGKYQDAHLYFTSTLRKQIEYVGFEKDHPFLEQCYLHMATMYKTMGNLTSSHIMWKELLKCHQRVYGENSYMLANDYKNIGTWEIGIGKNEEALQNLELAKKLWKIAIEELDKPQFIKEEKRELAEIYFALYLVHVAKNDWDQAIIANEHSKNLNIEVLGEDDLEVANSYYMSAQMYLKKLYVDEALTEINKAIEITNKRGTSEPVIPSRYHFMRAKLYKNKEQNKEALADINISLAKIEGNVQFFSDEVEIKSFRKNLILTLSDEQLQEYGIDLEEEKRRDAEDEEKRKNTELQIRKIQIEEQLKKQGMDPSRVDISKILSDDPEKTEEEEEEETFFDTPLGLATTVAGFAAAWTGIVYWWKQANSA